ncbi:MAG: hypothetical protein EOP85_09910 [Verrucomicrobiaceae bacterium]|nr:MAG: hypothetical protein EOP85_09910 [Verrucomicrobiaceae bacterium]
MRNLLPLAVSLVLAAAASAETSFPRGSFGFAEIEKAKAAATAQNKDLAFIYTDKNTTCGLCQGAAAAFIDAVKSKTVIVHIDSKDTKNLWSKLPEAVRQGLTDGKFIPKIAVTDAAASKLTTSLTYEAYKEDDRKSIRGLKKALKAD